HLLESTVSRAELEIHAGNLTGTGDFGTRHPDYTWSFEAILAGSDDTILLYETTATIQGPEEERQLKFYVYDIGLGSLIEGSGAGNNMFNEGSMSRRATFNQQGGASQRDTSQRSTSTTRGRSGGSVYE
ncbi:MAG: hypothetical protein HYZ00_00320, partial [Candidatus Hydrogenedentes bacterium]|nr:hypothetical protein [Candidatus Hydrogenedentota bacterium]